MTTKIEEIVKSTIFGHAVGDALGVPAEFIPRHILKQNPISDMTGYGTHRQPAGTWSDDTSLTLASLDCLSKGLNYNSIMDSFVRWESYADYTATGMVFDEGIATHKAISNFETGIKAVNCGGLNEYDNGNGSLMRIIPFILYSYYKFDDTDTRIKIIHESSALTHGHMRSKVGCGIYAFIFFNLLETADKNSIYNGIKQAYDYYSKKHKTKKELAYYDIFDGSLKNKNENDIKSSGYVVDSLVSAIWCVLNTDSYSECVLKAVNLGDDTDTISAIAGGIAGLLYGLENIPKKWLEVLKKSDMINELCEKFADSLNNN